MKFVVWRGVVGWGISTFILFTAVQIFFQKTPDIRQAAIYLVLFMAGGVLWGLSVWQFRAKTHRAPR
ncbi:MAG: hypothetical protein V4764_16845 [Burkholderia sp.]